MKMSEERITECFGALSRLSTKPETMTRDIERARQAVVETASSRAKRTVFQGSSFWGRGVGIAAVLCVGAGIILWLLDSGVEIDGASIAVARVMKALEKPRLMHEVLETERDDNKSHRSEWWYDFGSRILLAKYSADGRCVKISSMNYNTMEHVVYYPDVNEVQIVYRCDMSPDGYPDAASEVVSSELEHRISRGAKVELERTRENGIDVDVYRSVIERNEHRNKEASTLVVDRETNLPVSIKTKQWTKEGAVVFDQTISLEFPAVGPRDIYDIGAPRSAPVVLDVAAKRRYERKLAIEEQIPRLEAEWTRVLREEYRLLDGQVLALIPPALARARIESQQAHEEVRALVDEQVRERDAPLRPAATEPASQEDSILSEPPGIQYELFAWDGGIDMKSGRPVFCGGASLRDGMDRIVGLSVFEYEIAEALADVNIPGDWIVRKDSAGEERLAAFERIIQTQTGRAIRFHAQIVQREVIVARGTFHSQPLSGAYDDSWIHVYADQLDPDERSGGGAGSLRKFIRCLGEVNLNRQVLDETTGDREVEVSYGWHKSGYVRLIADETEKAEKLRMVLDNVSRQTGLTFSIERRMVPKWVVTVDR